MGTDIKESKQALRREVRERLKGLTQEQRTESSARARSLLKEQPVWRRARSLLFFAPLPQEVDIWPLLPEALAAGKTVALPRFDPQRQCYAACPITDMDKDILPGAFGIREPVARCAENLLKKLDFILVPGIAFDLHGHRLGRGKGYYDQLLTAVSGTACGVAFDEQILRQVPVEPHDRPLNCILTPTRWIEL